MAYVTELTPKEYWIRIAFLLVELVVVSAILFVILDTQDAEQAGASALRVVVATGILILMAINAVIIFVAMMLAVLRRARNTGSTLVWFLVGLIVPFGWVIVGLIPSRR